jgi:hypothetical protein
MLSSVHDAEDIFRRPICAHGVSYAEFETGRHCALGCIEQALRCPHEGILDCPNFATVFAAGIPLERRPLERPGAV